MLRSLLLTLTLTVASSGLLSCKKAPPYYLGLSVPLSHKEAMSGQSVLNAVLLSIDEVNQAGGIQGRPLKIEVQDSLVPFDKTAYQGKNLVGLIGLTQDQNLSDLVRFAETQEVPLFLTRYQALQPNTSHLPWVFQMEGSHQQQITRGLNYALANGFEKIFFLHDQSKEGKSQARKAGGIYTEKMNQRARILAYDPPNWSTLLKEIQAEEPHLIYFSGQYTAAVNLMARLQENKNATPIMGNHLLHNTDFIRLLGKNIAQEIYLTAPKMPSSPQFTAKYAHRFGDPLTKEAKYAYDASSMLLELLKSRHKNRKEPLNQGLFNRMLPEGVSGPALFSIEGENIKAQFDIWSVNTNGQFEKAPLKMPLYSKSGAKLAGYFKQAEAMRSAPKKSLL